MFHVGPYTFTDNDARRTVDNLEVFWDQLSVGRDRSIIEPLWPELTGDLRTDLGLSWAAIMAAGPAMRAEGQMPASVTGSVAQLSVSKGGVPKKAVPEVHVTFSGVEGDLQATRVHHGRPWQALCIWAVEPIEHLRSLGHPIAPGLAGENITLRGLPWAEVRCGTRLRIGTVLAEVSLYALPCSSNKRWFLDGDFSAMHHDKGPVSRIYATVLEPGTIAIDDDAILEPAP